MAGNTIGEAYVAIRPDMTGFETQLAAGVTFEVMHDTFVRSPGESSYNPEGLPERTIKEVRLQEFGPVWPPAYRGTSAGIRVAD
jgi:hypothetical protein